MAQRFARDSTFLAAGLGSLALVVSVYRYVLGVSNPTIAALTFLLVVLIVASASRLWVAVVTAVGAMLAFNYFFLPPVGTLTIADPQNWVALFVFLAVSLIASNLSAAVRPARRRPETGAMSWRACSISAATFL